MKKLLPTEKLIFGYTKGERLVRRSDFYSKISFSLTKQVIFSLGSPSDLFRYGNTAFL